MDTEYLAKMAKHLAKPIKRPPILPPKKLFSDYKRERNTEPKKKKSTKPIWCFLYPNCTLAHPPRLREHTRVPSPWVLHRGGEAR